MNKDDLTVHVCTFACLLLALIPGIVSGRRPRRSDWVTFWLKVTLSQALFLGSVFCIGQWSAWRAKDKRIQLRIEMAAAALVAHFADEDQYAGRFDLDIRRPRFRLDLGTPLLLGIMIGMPLGVLSLCVRGLLPARQLAEGRCRKCGYDLTGNITGRCPECGTPTAAVVASDAEYRRRYRWVP